MTIGTKALLVHLFTASGAVFAMLAMLAASEEEWSLMFLWLIVAFTVDGVDGPLARKYDVKQNAPRFDGVLLDLIIDYLTYVFIPAFALFKSGLLPGWTGWAAIIIITFASAVYFCDTNMKTKDNNSLGLSAKNGIVYSKNTIISEKINKDSIVLYITNNRKVLNIDIEK